jgi:abortive infection bacteriophage resistance protein
MLKINYSKLFLSCPAQIALLKTRGMQFTDEAKAKHLLENISYYRFSGYWYPLLEDFEIGKKQTRYCQSVWIIRQRICILVA